MNAGHHEIARGGASGAPALEKRVSGEFSSVALG